MLMYVHMWYYDLPNARVPSHTEGVAHVGSFVAPRLCCPKLQACLVILRVLHMLAALLPQAPDLFGTRSNSGRPGKYTAESSRDLA